MTSRPGLLRLSLIGAVVAITPAACLLWCQRRRRSR
jgi:hypothetical protein